MQADAATTPQPDPTTGLRALPRLATNWDVPAGSCFTWGAVLAIHRIGGYTVVEYAEDNARTRGADMATLRAEHGTTRFMGYSGRAAGHSADSLEGALVEAIVRSRHHINSQAGSHLMTLIEADAGKSLHPGATLGGTRSLTRGTVPNPYDAPYWRGADEEPPERVERTNLAADAAPR